MYTICKYKASIRTSLRYEINVAIVKEGFKIIKIIILRFIVDHVDNIKINGYSGA